MRRTIQREVDNQLSRLVLEGSLSPGQRVTIDAGEDGLTFSISDGAPPRRTYARPAAGR